LHSSQSSLPRWLIAVLPDGAPSSDSGPVPDPFAQATVALRSNFQKIDAPWIVHAQPVRLIGGSDQITRRTAHSLDRWQANFGPLRAASELPYDPRPPGPRHNERIGMPKILRMKTGPFHKQKKWRRQP